ncbi:hypothetical protein H5410_036812 [Solanum commersonii]|uniref:Reverse transcriptase zinc-binding domain-containing protein n=1 Tax=Solanum commersonii TaxID=4109 RepID=A0A9J5Y8G9_SOLCO|nr:hypothetical protein H5410_036812 [Solanum commersonii]
MHAWVPVIHATRPHARTRGQGGLEFRSQFDVSKALFAKLWWNFRTTNSLWSNFIWNKYCKRHRPQIVEWRGGSQVWKMMLHARDQMDQEIWWEPRCGHSSTWFDNWTQLASWCLEDVNQLMVNGRWNKNLMSDTFTKEFCDQVSADRDKPWWMPDSKERDPFQSLFPSMENLVSKNTYWGSFGPAGIQGPFMHLKQTVNKWWDFDCVAKLKPLHKELSVFIIWRICKRRNVIKHGENDQKWDD